MHSNIEFSATPVTAKSLGRSYMIDGGTLEHAYKYNWSGFLTWEQCPPADNWVLLPENLGPHLSIDESSLHDDLFTIILLEKKNYIPYLFFALK